MAVLSACPPEAEREQTVPVGSSWLKFPELNAELCGEQQLGCGQGSRPLLAGMTGAEFSADGKQLSLGARFWKLNQVCDINGCVQVWGEVTKTLCYALEGATVVASTGCALPPALLPANLRLVQAGPMDGLTFDHSQRRALLGLDNGDARLQLGQGVALGEHRLSELDVLLDSPGAWDLTFDGALANTRTFTALTTATGSRLELLLPPPDARSLADGLIPASTSVFWANQADDVFALTLTEPLRLERRKVRSAITTPQTRTVAVRELDSETVSAVLSASSTTLSGVGGGDVLELSVVRTPKRTEPVEPLLPFGPFAAHAAGSQSVMVCFTQPLDDAALAAAQFSVSGVESLGVFGSSVAQCVRLATSPLPRNATLVLTVDGVKARSGDVSRTTRLSVTAPDRAPVPGVMEVKVPKGRQGLLPLDAQTLLISSGPEVATVDVAGVVVSLLGAGAPSAGGQVQARPDAAAAGLWVSYALPGGQFALQLQTLAGVRDLSGADLVSGSPPFPAGDGSALVFGAAGNVVRVSASGREVLPRVPNADLADVLGAGKVLVRSGARLQVLTLPDTLESASFAAPAGLPASLSPGQAFESGGETWCCASGRLWRLGDAESADVAPCSELTRDGRGVLWATEQGTAPKLRRVTGREVLEVTVTNPLAPDGGVLLAPRFHGAHTWFDPPGADRPLRVEDATWRALAGQTP